MTDHDVGLTSNGASRSESSGGESATSSTEGDLTIGMYHPRAGTRSAGGIAVYVRELVERLGALRPTYLYTETTGTDAALSDSPAELVPIQPDAGVTRVQTMAARSPVSLATLSPQLAESAATFASALRDGTVAHLNATVDILFTHNLFDTVFLSNVADVPVVRMFHGCKTAGLGSTLCGLLSAQQACLANSPQTAADVRDHLGLDVAGIVPPGIDPDRFSPDRNPAFECEEPTVLFVGRFVAGKGLYDLLDAFTALDSPARLVLVGRGERHALQAELDARAIGDSVTVVGEVPHERMPEYYAGADVVCLPTRYEGFGMVNIEAMACGVPVVTTDLPGIRAYASDEVNALLVPPGDTAALATALDRVLSSPELRERLATNGRETALEYSWERAAERLVGLSAETLVPVGSSR